MSGYNHVHEFGIIECYWCGAEKCEICGDDVERYEANHAEPIERFHQ